MKDRLKIVLDTNVLLVSISSRSDHHWIFQSLLQLFTENKHFSVLKKVDFPKIKIAVTVQQMKNVEILDCIDCVNAIQMLPSWQRLLTEYKNIAIFFFRFFAVFSGLNSYKLPIYPNSKR